jgi:hypothetical protein
MLEQLTFLKGIKYLNAYYTNFNFNINDEMKLKVWYEVFTAFDDKTFTDLVKSYCIKNIYAPQSPTHLFEYAKTVEINKQMSGDSAWDFALSLLRQLNYDFKRFYIECGYVIISDIIKVLKSDFDGIHTDKLPFVKNRFVALYNEALKKEVDKRIGLPLSQNLLPQ